MKLKITNAVFTVTLRKRNTFWEFKEVFTNTAFETKEEAIKELTKVFGPKCKITNI